MFRQVIALVMSVAALPAALPAAAQSDEDVYARIEQLQGDPDGFSEAFKLLTEAMRFGDPVTVGDLGEYPLKVDANGERYDIQSAADLVENYDALITQEIRNAVAGQDYASLFVNSEGVMFANGAIWMALVCDDSACGKSHWAITAINN